MHFDSRTQQALRDAGLSTDEIRTADERVKALTREDADALVAFFEGNETVYSDMDLAHSAGGVVEHTVDHLDCYTHADSIRGYLKFETWGVPVEGGRPLDDGLVELTLGPTVNTRTKFAADRDGL
ncbi:DUF7532 family protein [Halomarina oriensis]|uniref:Uncharacterized protein n=1 Tax=Halomarina oriensis TaxID=671145 RepID=A0A6B0GV00_9EURY|nr:hypothetical protein [Halomarina oriensis]MWG35548.1 hypothetical protein [Halomarina oriensis]